jgi:hypothetical protein
VSNKNKTKLGDLFHVCRELRTRLKKQGALFYVCGMMIERLKAREVLQSMFTERSKNEIHYMSFEERKSIKSLSLQGDAR